MTLKVKHRIGNPMLHFVRDSVFNEAILEGLIARVDLVYHLAAVVGVEHYVGDPYQVLNVNVNGTQNVLKLAFKHSKRVVFSSTSEVYGRNPSIPWSEDDDRVLGSTRIDRWCYSTSKAVGEHFCFAYAKMGLKPTQYRCAAEALLRRFRKEGSLPRLHPLVDLCNAVSVAFAIPVAVLDVARVGWPLEVRYAAGDEDYLTFGGDVEHPDAGEVIFADRAGRVGRMTRWSSSARPSALRSITRGSPRNSRR